MELRAYRAKPRSGCADSTNFKDSVSWFLKVRLVVQQGLPCRLVVSDEILVSCAVNSSNYASLVEAMDGYDGNAETLKQNSPNSFAWFVGVFNAVLGGLREKAESEGAPGTQPGCRSAYVRRSYRVDGQLHTRDEIKLAFRLSGKLIEGR